MWLLLWFRFVRLLLRSIILPPSTLGFLLRHRVHLLFQARHVSVDLLDRRL